MEGFFDVGGSDGQVVDVFVGGVCYGVGDGVDYWDYYYFGDVFGWIGW